MDQYVTDTHPLLWYVTDDNRLSSKANSLLERGEAGEVKIIIPAIVLIEAIDILNKRRIIYGPTELLNWLSQNPQFVIKNLDWDIIVLFKNYISPTPKDSRDKIIIVTAQFYGNIPIITKDPDIQQVYPSTIW